MGGKGEDTIWTEAQKYKNKTIIITIRTSER